MGKLFIRLTLFLIGINFTFGQDTLCVFKTNGTSIIKLKANERPIKKGDLISGDVLVKILPSSQITAIDNSGNVYPITVEGTYDLNNLLNFKTSKQKSNFTAEYFKHIWEELKNSSVDKALIAGVFRGETLMTYPPDKARIGSSRIALKWDDSNTSIAMYYVFVRNPITDEIIKIETNGSQLAIYDDNPIFYDSEMFEWTVSTEAFPNLNNIPFYSFELIDRNIYNDAIKEYSNFINDLKSIGMSDEEITTIICKTYKLCK